MSDMFCGHDIAMMETAAADGRCPICLSVKVAMLRAALTDARDALRNDFEPDNQSRAWHRANDALEQARKE